MELDAAATADKEEKPQYVKPIRCNVGISITKMEWTTEVTDEKGETTTSTELQTFDRQEMALSAW